MIFYTSVNLNYIPKARLLAASIKAVMPESTFVLALLDDEQVSINDVDKNFDEILTHSDLEIENFYSWIFRYDVVEACTAQKGRVLKLLLDRYPDDDVIYLDPDIQVFSPFIEVENALNESHVILTPHLTDPETTKRGIEGNELSALIHGTYNLGFLAVRNSPEGKHFADWWDSRLQSYCFDEKDRGLFTDQKWIDLAPGFFNGVGILRNPGYNVATWNIGRRDITFDSNRNTYLVNNVPLRFIHFSGFDSGAHQAALEEFTHKGSIFRKLSKIYTQKLEEFEKITPQYPDWKFSKLEDGTKIPSTWRRFYRDNPHLNERITDPFGLEQGDFTDEKVQAPYKANGFSLVKFVTDPRYFDCDISIDGAGVFLGKSIAVESGVNPTLTAIKAFCDDYVGDLRQDWKILSEFNSRLNPSLPTIAYISHGLGGGVDKHIEQLARLGNNKANIFLLHPHEASEFMGKLSLLNSEDCLALPIIDPNAERITRLFNMLNVTTIHVHQAIGNDALVRDLLRNKDFRTIITLHDYYFLTPNWRFQSQVSNTYEFPKTLSELALINQSIDPEIKEVWGSVEAWIDALEKADLLIYPSCSTRDDFSYFVNCERQLVAYHPEFPHPELFPERSNVTRIRRGLRVGLFGDFGPHKGSDIAKRIILSSPSGISFVGFGSATSELLESPIDWKGVYQSSEIVGLLLSHEIDVILLPFQVNETYSYTLSEALRSGLPIVASDIPVVAERTKSRTNVNLVPHNASAEVWIEKILMVNKQESGKALPDNINMHHESREFYLSDYWNQLNIDS